MMKKTCFLFLLLCYGLALMAQDFEIVSVESLPLDMSAREEIYTDHNNRQCALLRIATQNIAPNQRELFNFVPDYGSEMVQRATRDGEIWLWVSPGLKYLRVKHRDWGQYELRLIDHVARVEALHTYKITIKGTLVMALQEQNSNSPTQQYLVFQLSPTNAMLEVNGQLWEVAPDGTAMKFVNFGTYSYRVQAPNYLPETGKVTVDDPNNTKTVNVNLKSDFVEVTLKVDADAEIWVNNEKKGTRTWTGQLGKGTYKIECKQASHETSMISKEITADTDGQTISLPAPKPIYGSLSIESTPNFANVYLDGKEIGKTPKFIPELLIGQHEVLVVRDGYSEYKEIVTIKKAERQRIQASLSSGHGVLFTCNEKNAALYIDGVAVGSANGIYLLNNGNHRIEVNAEGYQYYSKNIYVSDDYKKCDIALKKYAKSQIVNDDKSIAKTNKNNRGSWKSIKYLEILSFAYSINSIGSGGVFTGGVGSINKGNLVGWYASYKGHILSHDMNSTIGLISMEVGGGIAIRLNNGAGKHKFLLLSGADFGYSALDYYGSKGLSGILNTKVEYMHDGNGLAVYTEGFVGRFGALTCYGINIGLSWTLVE